MEQKDALKLRIKELESENADLRDALQNISTGNIPDIHGTVIVNDTIKGYAAALAAIKEAGSKGEARRIASQAKGHGHIELNDNN